MPRNETVRTPRPTRLKVGILTWDGTLSDLGNAIEVAGSTEHKDEQKDAGRSENAPRTSSGGCLSLDGASK